MKIRSWQTECSLRRQNQGKKGGAEIHNEDQRHQLQKSISTLAEKWRSEESEMRKQTERQAKDMTTEQRSKLRELVHHELRRNHWGNYEKFEIALASVVKAHPEFANAKTELLTEFANEQSRKPSPLAFRAEVLREVKVSGLSYDEAFSLVLERYPSMKTQWQFHNENLADSRAAGVELQERLDQYFKDHPHLDRKVLSTYQNSFNRVCEMHPEIVARMHVPGRSAVNLWVKHSSDGKTPAVPLKATDRQMPNSPAERAAKA